MRDSANSYEVNRRLQKSVEKSRKKEIQKAGHHIEKTILRKRSVAGKILRMMKRDVTGKEANRQRKDVRM